MTARDAIDLILDEKTPEKLRNSLRRAVYQRFDEMYAEACGRRRRPNQAVYDMLRNPHAGPCNRNRRRETHA